MTPVMLNSTVWQENLASKQYGLVIGAIGPSGAAEFARHVGVMEAVQTMAWLSEA